MTALEKRIREITKKVQECEGTEEVVFRVLLTKQEQKSYWRELRALEENFDYWLEDGALIVTYSNDF